MARSSLLQKANSPYKIRENDAFQLEMNKQMSDNSMASLWKVRLGKTRGFFQEMFIPNNLALEDGVETIYFWLKLDEEGSIYPLGMLSSDIPTKMNSMVRDNS